MEYLDYILVLCCIHQASRGFSENEGHIGLNISEPDEDLGWVARWSYTVVICIMSPSWPPTAVKIQEAQSWTNNVCGNLLAISQYVTWITDSAGCPKLVPLYCRLKKGNGGISHISKVPSVVAGILKKNPALRSCEMRGETYFSSSRPLGVAWRYGIVWPASRRACRIGHFRAAGAMYDDELGRGRKPRSGW